MCMHAEEVRPREFRRKNAVLTFEEVIAHIGGLENFHTKDAREQMRFTAKDYIWKYPPREDDGNAYCTACGSTLEAGRWKSPVKHNKTTNCPYCEKSVTFKYVAKGHSSEFDQFVFYEWQKSKIEDEAVVLTATHVWRDSTHWRPEEAPLNMAASAIYLLRPGKAPMIYKRGGYNERAPKAEEFDRVKGDATPEENKYGMYGSHPDIEVYGVWRVENSRIFRTWRELSEEAGIYTALPLSALANVSRWPWLEYMMRAGQGKLAARIAMSGTGGADVINARGKSLREVLRLTEGQWYEVRQRKIRLTVSTLKSLHALEILGYDAPKVEDAQKLEGHEYTLWRMANEMPKLLAGVPEKLRKKVMRRAAREVRYGSEWCDYLEELRELGEDLTDEALVLPKDVRRKHEETSARLTAIRQERSAAAKTAMQRAFQTERLPKLKKDFTFSARGLVLRPFETATEIIGEGSTQRICIGSYVNRYFEGQTVICCLRRANEPDEPWRDVEFDVRTGRLVQDRGFRNDTDGIDQGTTKLLRLFWADFEEWRKAA